MIVEDSVNMRKFLTGLFKDRFTDIYETSSGREAVELYRLHLPDMVFMDVNIEELDGIKTTKKIKSEYPEAKIVMVSQYNNPKIMKAAADAGATDYVIKDDLSRLFDITNIDPSS